MRLFKLFFTAAFLLSMDAYAEIVKDGDDSSVVATIAGPAGMVINAESKDINVSDEGSTLSVTISSFSFKTGIGLRDKHLADAIESRNYPSMTVAFVDSDVKIPTSEDSEHRIVPATLTFHGVTRSVKIDYVAATDCDGHIGVNADFDIDIREYGVVPPSYLGVGIKPIVHIHTWIRLIDIDGC